ncbi:MAG: DivIVA domain-containing protein [Solirubrobacterales bacterium]|nr:DivIVA domain-containing protein [Solirubrobacterales bacterium]MBV9944234.1 DivIVA domain-containing protein [Solirubrobacterales bacterium]
MSDFERNGTTYDEPVKRRSPGTWFADLGDKLSRGFSSFDRPVDDDPVWEAYDETDQPTAAADPVEWDPAAKRFPTALHGYDREAVDAHVAALEREIAELRQRRPPMPALDEELERVGEETSAILKVAHAQAAEITRRAQAEADRCLSDAAANAVAMTENAKRNLRQLDTETDAVWAERGRLIEDVRNVATALFSLAEDAADRFPEDAERGTSAATVAAPAPVPPADPEAAPAPAAAPVPAAADTVAEPAPAAPPVAGAPPELAARPAPAAPPVAGAPPETAAPSGMEEDRPAVDSAPWTD